MRYGLTACVGLGIGMLVVLSTEARSQDERREGNRRGPIERAVSGVGRQVDRVARRAAIERQLRDARENQAEFRNRMRQELQTRIERWDDADDRREQAEEARERREEVREEVRERAEEARERAREARDDRRDGDDNFRVWNDWTGQSYRIHRDWYRGPWRGPVKSDGWDVWWEDRWERYPVASALGVTNWGLRRGAYVFGLGGYRNPFFSKQDVAIFDYSQPLYHYAVDVDTASDAMQVFADARRAFLDGNHRRALDLVNEILGKVPGDTTVHQFRGLTLFALKKYRSAAETVYAVLFMGPGWNQATMVGLYPDEGAYLKQLNDLADYANENPDSPEAHFLLGYHNLLAGKAEAASRAFNRFVALVPDDPLGQDLLAMLGTVPQSARAPVAVAPVVVEPRTMVGSWQASWDGRTYELMLEPNGEFIWLVPDRDPGEVRGAYVLEGNEIVLEADDGAVLIANIDPGKEGFGLRIAGGGTVLQFRR